MPLGLDCPLSELRLSPGLKHGRVESIDQLARYHAQSNTPMEWCRQFCSGETRFKRYVVYPEWLSFRFSKPKKQSCPVEYLSFLIRIVLDLICWYPVRQVFNHRKEGISPLVRWFKFTLKPPYSIAHDKLRLAIWDTSFWTFWLKFGHKGP